MPRLEVIVPKGLLFDTRRLSRAIDNALDGAALAAKADFGATTRTWKKRPTFYIRRTKPGVRDVYTTDLIYHFVSGGTRVRYATMTPGFRPKSRKRYIGSNVGRGGMAYISKKHPRPGIEAREFPEAVGEKWDRELPKILQRAIDAEV